MLFLQNKICYMPLLKVLKSKMIYYNFGLKILKVKFNYQRKL